MTIPIDGGKTAAAGEGAEKERVFRAFRRPWMLGAATGGALLLGLGLGGALTALTTRPDAAVGSARIGPWLFWPDAGTLDSNPYVRARLALSGQVPLAAAEGLTFVARTDDGKRPLRRLCDYRVTGPVPHALFWSLQAADLDGTSIPNPLDRAAFTATDVLRDDAGGFAIQVSALARPGNWLPVGGTGSFLIVLRLYEAATSGGLRDLGDLPLPHIVEVGCRA